ncbi:MAG: AmmeMemoRadiSam system protein A [Chloroflexi bacterium]|nr:AmmeMemoRadiSam system protein A [Chloroflexota bacterium]
MSLVFGCIVPHPPLMVPQVGQGQERRISATLKGMGKVASTLAQSHPQALFIISPHGPTQLDAMGVVAAESTHGDMDQWGAPGLGLTFDNDLEAVTLLLEEARAARIPLRVLGQRGYELDHGVMAPMLHLAPKVKGVSLVPLTFCWLPLEAHFHFGQILGKVAAKLDKRVAIVASGDLSHRLLPEAPAGYDPLGQVFDKTLVEKVAARDSQGILALDPDLIERAGECGLRSIVILLGALAGLEVKPQVLSYEGPFGVGYLTATMTIKGPIKKRAQANRQKENPSAPEAQSPHPIAALARQAVERYVLQETMPEPLAATPEMGERAGVFVSIKKWGELRGCIGTFVPTCPQVAAEVIANAVSSACRDPRFPPVQPSELPHLSYSVDILSPLEAVDGLEALDPKVFGCVVEAGGRRGLLLPDLEGVETAEQQVAICCFKAGIDPGGGLKLFRFRVQRYE